jgi:hypothetical protein
MIIHRHVSIKFDSNNNINIMIVRANPKKLGVSIENRYDFVSPLSVGRLERLLNKYQGYVSLYNRWVSWDVEKYTDE